MNALEIKDLCKSYPGFALERLNLTLPSGCVMGLVGENGAGKSTTIRLILDMIQRDSGCIRIMGRDNKEQICDTRENIGVVLDEVGISECLTPKMVGKIMERTFRQWEPSVFEGYLQRFDLPADKKFGDFSRGMRMKLGIAIALSHRPKLLILDEATSGLDPVVRDEILDIFGEFTRDENHSILISSHIVSDLEKICDYIAFLHKGELLLCEEKDLLKERYGIIRCGAEEFLDIAPGVVKGKKESPYGVEAIVERGAVPRGWDVSPVDIEQLFIFMVKEAS